MKQLQLIVTLVYGHKKNLRKKAHHKQKIKTKLKDKSNKYEHQTTIEYKKNERLKSVFIIFLYL